MSEKGFLIGPAFAGALKELVDKDRQAVSQSQYTRIETRFEDLPSRRSGKVFRICTFTGAWAINSAKTVTFRGVTATPNTVAAVNLFCGLNPGTVTCDVSIAQDGTAWYLVQPNLTQQPGYSQGGTNVMTISNGSIRWMPTLVCNGVTATAT